LVAVLAGGKNGNGNNQVTTGSIQVNSTPTGAKVYLNGTDTGRTTNCTLTNIQPGSHTVKLVKDGYVDYSGSASVTAGQTATVNATLTKNTVAVSAPAAGAFLLKNISYNIQWTVGSTAATQAQASVAGLVEQGVPGRQQLLTQRMSAVRANRGERTTRADSRASSMAANSEERGLQASGVRIPRLLKATERPCLGRRSAPAGPPRFL
jgi:hypothetical protein